MYELTWAFFLLMGVVFILGARRFIRWEVRVLKQELPWLTKTGWPFVLWSEGARQFETWLLRTMGVVLVGLATYMLVDNAI